jgi:hypothetical protein
MSTFATTLGLLGRPKIDSPKRTHNRDITPPLARDVKRGFIERVLHRVMSVLPADAQKRIVEGIAGGTLLGQWGAGDDDFNGYRPLSARIDSITRDLDATTYDQVIRQALYTYATNPLGGWMVDKLVELAVGQELKFTVKVDPALFEDEDDKKPAREAFEPGVTPEEHAAEKTAEREKLDERNDRVRALEMEIQEHLERFWKNAAHNIEARADEYATTWLVTGCLLLPVKLNPADGVPMLDLIDAQQIAKVETADKSAIVAGRVHYRPQNDAGNTKALEVIRETVDGFVGLLPKLPPAPEKARPAVGKDGKITEADAPAMQEIAFYFPLRALLNSVMGVPYLMRAIDWLDRLDQGLFAGLDKAKMNNAIAWHVKLDNITESDAKAKSDQYKRDGTFTDPGSVLVTNQHGDVKAVTPDIQAAETETLARVYRLHILGGYNYPESWYGAGGETNRATAGDQSDITLKSIVRWQNRIRNIFDTMLAFAYDAGRATQGELRSAWPDRRKGGAVKITVDMPLIQQRDAQELADVLTKIEAAFSAAIEEELISRETARKVFIAAASKLGVDINEADELKRIEEESEDRDAKAAELQNKMAEERLRLGLEDDDDPSAPPVPPPPVPPAMREAVERLTERVDALATPPASAAPASLFTIT